MESLKSYVHGGKTPSSNNHIIICSITTRRLCDAFAYICYSKHHRCWSRSDVQGPQSGISGVRPCHIKNLFAHEHSFMNASHLYELCSEGLHHPCFTTTASQSNHLAIDTGFSDLETDTDQNSLQYLQGLVCHRSRCF